MKKNRIIKKRKFEKFKSFSLEEGKLEEIENFVSEKEKVF